MTSDTYPVHGRDGLEGRTLGTLGACAQDRDGHRTDFIEFKTLQPSLIGLLAAVHC